MDQLWKGADGWHLGYHYQLLLPFDERDMVALQRHQWQTELDKQISNRDVGYGDEGKIAFLEWLLRGKC